MQPSTEPWLHELPPQVGRYRILERIDTGGMGTVYKAHDPQLDRVVAVKVPRFGDNDVPATRLERFRREARAAARIWHPHVCPIYDVGEENGCPYVVMAFVTGESLAAKLDRAGAPLDEHEAVEVTIQILDALSAIHAQGILHRDLKPGNIMIDAAGRPVVTDFGLARPEQEAERLTSDGVILGTPSYMAPEQAAGEADKLGPWTDLYSVGVILYQMLAGRLPFDGPPLVVLGKIVNEPPRPLSSFRKDIDPDLQTIVLKSLAKDGRDRYRSAEEFARALGEWDNKKRSPMNGRADAATATLQLEESGPFRLRKPLAVAAAGKPPRWVLLVYGLAAGLALTVLLALVFRPEILNGKNTFIRTQSDDSRPTETQVLSYLDGKPLSLTWDKDKKLVIDKKRIRQITAGGSERVNNDPWWYEYTVLYQEGTANYVIDLSVQVRRLGEHLAFVGLKVKRATKAGIE